MLPFDAHPITKLLVLEIDPGAQYFVLARDRGDLPLFYGFVRFAPKIVSTGPSARARVPSAQRASFGKQPARGFDFWIPVSLGFCQGRRFGTLFFCHATAFLTPV